MAARWNPVLSVWKHYQTLIYVYHHAVHIFVEFTETSPRIHMLPKYVINTHEIANCHYFAKMFNIDYIDVDTSLTFSIVEWCSENRLQVTSDLLEPATRTGLC